MKVLSLVLSGWSVTTPTIGKKTLSTNDPHSVL